MAGGRATRPIVLVHGSWLGGWCWEKVVPRLRQAGHAVFTPTMTGVGDRHHLLDSSVTLETWVADVLDLLEAENLRDVILVGHSFGGRVVTGVADRAPERIDRVIFLDSVLARSGQSLLDQLDPVARNKRIQLAEATGGVAIPPPAPETLGILHPEDQLIYHSRASPQPLGTNSGSISYRAPIGNGRPVSFVAFTDPLYPASVHAHEFARTQPDWHVTELAVGHCPMFSHPDALAATLLALAAR